MMWLLLSVLANTGIYLVFKYFGMKGISLFPAIVTNYLVAFTIGVCMVSDWSIATEGALKLPQWFVGGVSLGLIFIGIFYLMAVTAQKMGVSVSTIASKMSLALGVALLVLFDPFERFNTIKIIAITLALSGVVMVSMRSSDHRFHWSLLGYPLAILLGSTIIDFGVAWFSRFPESQSELELFSCLSFGTAGITGILVLLLRQFAGNPVKIRKQDIVAGAALGAINYGSIYFLVMAYDTIQWHRSIVLPVNNLAVVAIGALAARILFKEKLSAVNLGGIVMCMIAFILLIQQA